LAGLKVFIPWRLEWNPKDKKWKKRPYRIGSKAKGFPDKWNEPQNLNTFETVAAWIKGEPGGRTLQEGEVAGGWGIGLVGATGEGRPCALDFDNVIDENGRILNPDLADWVRMTKGEIYWERSLSGTGLHAIGLGLTPTREEKVLLLSRGGEIEVLKDKIYCALTGDRFEGSTLNPGNIQALYDEAIREATAPKDQKQKKAAPPKTVQAIAQSSSKTSQGKELRDVVRERATAWVEKREASVAGQHGHKALMEVAAALRHGWGYADPSRAASWEDDGYAIFEAYNRRAAPPESEEELRRKWSQADGRGNENDFFAKALKDHEEFAAKRSSPGSSQNPKQAKKKAALVACPFVPASQVPDLKRTDWLIVNLIELGTFGTLSGFPQAGKSTAISGIAAAVTLSSGTYSPCGTIPGFIGQQEGRHVGWVSCEEDASRIKTRFELAGGDLSKFHICTDLKLTDKTKRWFSLPKDAPLLRAFIERAKPALLVMDSMSGLVEASYDLAKGQKARQILNQLVLLAHEFQISIVVISHFTKGSLERPGPQHTRAEGSVGVSAAARFAMTAVVHPDDEADENIPDHEKRRILYGAKVSNGTPGWGFPFKTKKAYKGEADVVIPAWEDAVLMGDSKFLKKAEPTKPGPKPELRGEAKEAILELLQSRGGWMTAAEFNKNREAIEQRLGAKDRTFERARTELKREGSIGDGKDGLSWIVFLPGHDPRKKGSEPEEGKPVDLEAEILHLIDGGEVEEWQLYKPLEALQTKTGTTKKAIDNAKKILIGSGQVVVNGIGPGKKWRLGSLKEAGQGEEKAPSGSPEPGELGEDLVL
jgi:hypothetical protein